MARIGVRFGFAPRLHIGMVLLAVAVLTTSLFVGLEGWNSPSNTLHGDRANQEYAPAELQAAPLDREGPPAYYQPRTASLTSSSVGSVERTIFPGYNASLEGSFIASVWSWEVGTPAYIPATNSLWLPQHPAEVSGYPIPTSSPAAVFNLSRFAFAGFEKNISNSTALVFDPGNFKVYATQPQSDSVLAIDPITGAVVGKPIPVGSDPTALAYDPDNDTIYVVNTGSANVTVINAANDQAIFGGVPVGANPVSIVADPIDNLVFVANSGSKNVTEINGSAPAKPTGKQVPLIFGEPSVMAYSPVSDTVLVSVPTSDYATIFEASTVGVVTSVEPVGQGVAAATTSGNGTEFVLGNGTGTDVELVNSTGQSAVVTKIVGSQNVSEIIAPINGSAFGWASSTRVLETINLTTQRVTATSMSTSPGIVSLNGFGNRSMIYAASPNGSVMYVIPTEIASGQFADLVTPYPPLSLVVDPSTDRLFVGTTDGLEVYNATSQKLIDEIPGLGGTCSQLQLDLQDNVLWLANANLGAVAMNLTSYKLTSTDVPVWSDSATGIAIDSSASLAFILKSSTTAEVLDSRTGVIENSSVLVGSNVTGLVFDSADDQIYAAGDQVVTLNASTLTSDGSPIRLGEPHRILGEIYDPSRMDVYIGTSGLLPAGEGSIVVLDGSSVATSDGGFIEIPVGESPDALGLISGGVHAGTGTTSVWVANARSGTLSVIASPPQITSFVASPSTIDLGYPTAFDVAFQGGAGNSTVSYAHLPTGCVSTDSTQLNCTPTVNGTFSVSVTVTDSFGFSANATATLTVERSLLVRESFSPSTFPLIDTGVALQCSVDAADGLAPYVYEWNFGDGATAPGSMVNHTYVEPGAFVVNVEVRDATGATANATREVTVVPAPAVFIAAHPENVTDVDVPVTLNATILGGVAASTETWTFGDSTEATGANVTHAWTRAGNYTVTFDYSDVLGEPSDRQISVHVNPSLAATFTSGTSSSSGPASPGTQVQFSTQVSGGTPSYDVEWSFGDGSYSTGLLVNHSYASIGTYRVHVVLVDSVGAVVQANLSVIVSPATTSSGGLSSISGGFAAGLFLGLVVGGFLAALVLFAVGLRKGRKQGRTPPPSPSPYVPP